MVKVNKQKDNDMENLILQSACRTTRYFEYQKGDRASQFSAHFYCSQTAACIKMPRGMEVGLSPGDFVLDGNPATP